jgi:histidine triad (HIT) family protein
MADCVFCKIVSGVLPADKEYEDETVIAFRDIRPEAPIHIIVIPKKHISSIVEAYPEDQEVLGKIQLIIKNLVLQLNIQSGFKILVNGGKFQEVPHIHYHLLGGFERGDN